MKITSKHKRNSQIHSLPHKDTVEHTTTLDCACSPDLSMDNGHIMVEHHRFGGRSKKWDVRLANFGTKLLGGVR